MKGKKKKQGKRSRIKENAGLTLSLKIKKIGSRMRCGRTKSLRRFCEDRSHFVCLILWDKCATVEVSDGGLCETEPDFQQVLWREQVTQGHSNLLHTECHLKFRLLPHIYKHTLAYLRTLYSRGGKQEAVFTENRRTARFLFNKMRKKQHKISSG